MTKQQHQTLLYGVLVSLVLLLGICSESYGAEPVRVEVTSGRTFSGFVDKRTDDTRLWLRFEGQASLLYRPISWDRVEAVHYQGKPVAVETFKQNVDKIKTKGNLNAPPAVEQPKSNRPRTESDADAALEMLAEPRPVRSLEIEASVANWDADYEVDGVRVFVYPLDAYGQIVPVRGTVKVTLVGVRPASLPARYAFPRGYPFPTLGTWTRAVNPSSVGPNGAVVDLPFTSHDPSDELDLGAYGTVVARLTVPGTGVFEARADVVRIRPYQPIVIQ